MKLKEWRNEIEEWRNFQPKKRNRRFKEFQLGISKELSNELKSQLNIAEVLETKNREAEELKKSKNEEIAQLKQQLLLYKRMLTGVN